MTPAICFEDDTILILDKPAGMTVNNSETTAAAQTLQDWIEKKFKVPASPAGGQSSKFKVEDNSDFYQRAGIVHRLDKETSGVIIIAKTPQAFADLQRQFKERLVEKTYRSLAHGKIIPESGEIKVPVGRLPWNRKHFGVIAGGREAVTNYKVLAYLTCLFGNVNEVCSYVELSPKTGRTHQIRVHLQYIHHPIVSDFLYAGRKTSRNDRNILNRVFLHAYSISFAHPVTKEYVTYTAPLPRELQEVLSSCHK